MDFYIVPIDYEGIYKTHNFTVEIEMLYLEGRKNIYITVKDSDNSTVFYWADDGDMLRLPVTSIYRSEQWKFLLDHLTFTKNDIIITNLDPFIRINLNDHHRGHMISATIRVILNDKY